MILLHALNAYVTQVLFAINFSIKTCSVYALYTFDGKEQIYNVDWLAQYFKHQKKKREFIKYNFKFKQYCHMHIAILTSYRT